MAEMSTGYAPEYSAENISKLTNQYANLLQPEYARSGAQIANYMGGRGTLYGTPGSNKLQLLEANKMNQIGQYGLGLMNTGLGAQREERLTNQQRQYESPTQLAQLLGYTPGSSGTYDVNTGGWNWTGGQTQTVGGQTAEAAQTQANAAMNEAKAKEMSAILSAIGGLSTTEMFPGGPSPYQVALYAALAKYGFNL